MPFHWEIEFPEVFDRESPGFDAFVGNPPFAGRIRCGGEPEHLPRLAKGSIHEESHGNADLVAHFFRRAFDLLRERRRFGLIATNTIGQGDTRSTGLRWICKHGGEIYNAATSVKWPGRAAVVVSVVHALKGAGSGRYGARRARGRDYHRVPVPRGRQRRPAPLAANAGKSFQGSIVLGMGFTFDDTDTRASRRRSPRCERLIEETLGTPKRSSRTSAAKRSMTSPTHAHHRYVINFGEQDEAACRARWPELMAIVEQKVKPERMAQSDKGARQKWWQFIRPRPELQAAIAGFDRVLPIPRVSNASAFAFLPARVVYNEKLVVFPFDEDAAFWRLLHSMWVRFGSDSMTERAFRAG